MLVRLTTIIWPKQGIPIQYTIVSAMQRLCTLVCFSSPAPVLGFFLAIQIIPVICFLTYPSSLLARHFRQTLVPLSEWWEQKWTFWQNCDWTDRKAERKATGDGWKVRKIWRFNNKCISSAKAKKKKMLQRTKKSKQRKEDWFHRSCLVCEPWFSYISYVFHGAVKARGNPQCLQPLLNITRFGPHGHILWWGRLLEKGGVREGWWGVEERRQERGRKGGRKEVGSKGKVFKK